MQQLNEAIKTYSSTIGDIDTSVRAAAFTNLVDKTFGATASFGGLLATIPGMQVVGLSVWGLSVVGQEITSGTVSNATMGFMRSLDQYRVAGQQVNETTTTYNYSGFINSPLSAAQNVALGLSPEGLALNTAIQIDDAAGNAIEFVSVTRHNDMFYTIAYRGDRSQGNYVETYKETDLAGNLMALKHSSQNSPGGELQTTVFHVPRAGSHTPIEAATGGVTVPVLPNQLRISQVVDAPGWTFYEYSDGTARLLNADGDTVLNQTAGETMVRHPLSGMYLLTRANGARQYVDPLGKQTIYQAADGSGYVSGGDASIPFGVNGLSINSDGSVRVIPSNGLAEMTVFDTQDAFDLAICNTGNAERKGASDSQAEAYEVRNGLVASGGSWKLRYDADKLNNNQYVGGLQDNTVQAIITQALADHYRPGNGNMVRNVIDTNSLNAVLDPLGTPQFFKAPDAYTGYVLNSTNAWGRVTLPTDPLVLDLDGDGVRLTSYTEAPVLFDADNDGGSLEQTGWVSPTDGIVVMDRNGNGKIDNISETLSEYFGGVAGRDGEAGSKPFAHGFAALKSLDTNADQVFDALDTDWHNVKVWVDGNHDGKSWDDVNGDGVMDAGELSELKSLDELGITRIDLAHQVQSGEVRDGNEVLARGSFLQNGQRKEAIAANFLANPHGSTFVADGSGTQVTTEGDVVTGSLRSYAAGNGGETVYVADKGVHNAAGGNGDDILHGDDNNNWLAGGPGSDTLYGGAGDDVLIIDAEDLPHNIHGGAGNDVVQVVGARGVLLHLGDAEVEVAQGGRGDDVFIGGGRSSVFMEGGDGNDTLIGGAAADVLNGEDGADVIRGGAGNDVVRGGRGRDQIAGGSGNDVIDGGSDDDALHGDDGDDVIKGGGGDDWIDGGAGVDAVTLSGGYGEYRINCTQEGVWISDTVAGRDGTDFLKNIERANFRDVSQVEIPGTAAAGLDHPLPVGDVLHKNQAGQLFDRHQPHLIGKQQLLANDIDWQEDALHISAVFDVTGGSAQITAAGDVLFTPDAAFTGFMGFKYTIADSKGNPAATVVNISSGETAAMRAAVYLKTPELPDDPLLTEQWYLAAANVLPVWRDYSGKGVRIAQFETGGDFAASKEVLDFRHADLKPNIDAAWLANATPGQRAGEGRDAQFSEHATLVAGVMVAARNGEGGVGVAYDASLAGYWIGAKDLSALSRMRQYDVVNHSWGAGGNFHARFQPVVLGMMARAYQTALTQGRNGLGTVVVTAGGNQRQQGGNTNYSNISNTRASIVVGAMNGSTDLGALQFGGRPFSNPGASILVSAPGSNVSSTSRLVRGANGSTFGADHKVAQGTSFATPIVSGIVALMLEANPALGYRDVQQILALSAKKVNDPDSHWQINASRHWNGGGMHVSHDYGYGEVDARAAVRLAETWVTQQTFANEYHGANVAASGALDLAIHDGNTDGVRHTLLMDLGAASEISIEHVEVRLHLTHARAGDLIVKLISPGGTESILMDRPGKPANSVDTDRGDHDFDNSNTLDFIVDSALLRGERANGNWTLQVIDAASGDVGVLHDWSMNVFGSLVTLDDHYVYTDEYAQLAAVNGRNVLADNNGGKDTINAAALSSASRIDLSSGSATVAGAALTIRNPEGIENLIGGEFDDTLTGNGGNNVLVGGRGDDVLAGAGGADILFGGAGRNMLSGGDGGDFFVIEKDRRDAADSDAGITCGITTITDFTAGVDRIVLSGFSADVLLQMQIRQQDADTVVTIDEGVQYRIVLSNTVAANITPGAILCVPQGVAIRDVLAAQSRLPGADVADYMNPENHTSSQSTSNPAGSGNGDDILYLEGEEAVVGNGLAGGTFLTANLNFSGMGVQTRSGAVGGAGNDRFVLQLDSGDRAGSGLLKNLIDDFEVDNPQEKIDVSAITAVRSFADLHFSNFLLGGQRYLRVWLGSMARSTQYISLRGITAAELTADHFIFHGAAALPAPTPALLKVNGTDRDDTLTGDAGGNLLDGGPGRDLMDGRSGDDTYIVDDLGDVVREQAGGGYDLVKASVSHVLHDEVEVLMLTGSGHINGSGNALDNRIVGNAGNNVLDGGGGADILLGKRGDDTYVVDHTADSVIEMAEQGYDTVVASVSFTLGNHLERLLLSGTDAINGSGNAGPNRIRGNSGDNRLLGDAGDDSLDGGDGHDSIYGGRGNDRLVGGAGNDLLDGGSGNDVLIGERGDDTYLLYRGMGQDYVYDADVSAGNRDSIRVAADLTAADMQLARDGNDLLVMIADTNEGMRIGDWFGSSATKIERIQFAGGEHWDVAAIRARAATRAATAADVPYGRGWRERERSWRDAMGAGTQQSAHESADEFAHESAHESAYADGEAAPDTLVMYRGMGARTVAPANADAGAHPRGMDTVKIDAAISRDELVVTQAGNDLVLSVKNDWFAALRMRDGANHLQVQFADGEMWDSAALRQRVKPVNSGRGYAQWRLGFGAQYFGYTDSAVFSAASDGDDVLAGMAGNDVLFGGAGNDTLSANRGHAVLFGGAGNDKLLGKFGNDVLSGDVGNDELRGYYGNDVLLGGAGNDNLYGDYGNDMLFGGIGNDQLFGSYGNDVLFGAAGNDKLYGSYGHDVLCGGSGDDTLNGGQGRDFMIGGRGNDVIQSLWETDIIAFNRGDGIDRVSRQRIAWVQEEKSCLSLGGGIAYADLLLKKNGNDLIFATGNHEQIVMEDWYAQAGNQRIGVLQMIIDDTADYDATSASALHNKKIVQFDFDRLVAQFDAVRAADASVNQWTLSGALPDAHLAWRYARDGNLSSLPVARMRLLPAVGGFGHQVQALSLAA